MEERRADLPKGATVETVPGGLRISWPTFGSRWKYAILFFLWVVSLPAVALLLLLSIMSLVAGVPPSSYGESCGDLLAFSFLVLAWLVGAYFVAVGLFNSSIVQIYRGVLRTRSGPVPYVGEKSVDAASVRQVYVQLKARWGRYGSSAFYEIWVLTVDGRREKLTDVVDGSLALYVEREIEHFLGIEDQVVRGEWRPEPYLWEK